MLLGLLVAHICHLKVTFIARHQQCVSQIRPAHRSYSLQCLYCPWVLDWEVAILINLANLDVGAVLSVTYLVCHPNVLYWSDDLVRTEVFICWCPPFNTLQNWLNMLKVGIAAILYDFESELFCHSVFFNNSYFCHLSVEVDKVLRSCKFPFLLIVNSRIVYI